MYYLFMDFAIIVLEAVCCQMFFDVFQNKNDTGRRRFHKKIMAVLLMSALSFIAARLFCDMILIKQMVIFLLIVSIMTLVQSVPYKKAAVCALLFQGMLVVMEYLALIFVEIVIPDIESMDATQEVIGRALIVISLFFCFVTILLIKRIFRGHKNQIMYSEEWLKYVLFPVITVIMLSAILTTFQDEKDIGELQVLCGVGLGLVIMNFLVFFLLEDIISREEDAREREVLEIQGKNQMEMYRKMQENFERKKCEAHEFKNHLMCIQSLAEAQKYDELQRYVKKMNGDVLSGGIMIDTNNDIVNAVINTKYMEAAEKHIVVALRVNDLSQIKMEERDLVVLLSNLLNNAIEAAGKCEKDKVIHVKFIKEYGNIILSVKNHYEEPLIKVEGGFLTTKRHGKNMHGVGIKNVLKVIDRYHGTYDIDTEDNIFSFSVLIPDEDVVQKN